MADPWLGEIKLVPCDYVPRSYAQCDGALMSIAQHTALFSLLGTTYGGDGRQTFALPDLRGRSPSGQLNQLAPAATLPSQQQRMVASAAAVSGPAASTSTRPSNRVLTRATSGTCSPNELHATAVTGVPGSRLQANPSLHFVIALAGALPGRS
ncbi:MAG TPA: tail fiber protein [Polyangiales bacterium]|nr:tail fiber protein [Polyangiales bacterium]